MRRMGGFGLAMVAFASCSAPAKRINTSSNDIGSVKPALEDVMGQPSAFAKRPSEDVAEPVERRRLEDVSMSATFKPSKTFEFDKKSGLVFYEDGKGNGQVRRGLEIIEEGKIIDRFKNLNITILTSNDYEVLVHRTGFMNVIFTPEERHELERPKSK